MSDKPSVSRGRVRWKKATPATPRDSAVGVVVQRVDGRWRVLLGKRSTKSRFLPGAWAFIGGGLEDSDCPGTEGQFERCVAREVEEETTLSIAPERWHFAGVRITPPIFSVRYDTKFFCAELRDDEALPAEPPRPDEITELEFFDPQETLTLWESGATSIPPVLPPILRVLVDHPDSSVESVAERIADVNAFEQRVPRIEFAPGVWLIPQSTETLPPATHTNLYLVGGKKFLVVDTGSEEVEENERLLSVIARRRALGQEPVGIFLTHNHTDHVAGTRWVSDKLGLPVYAHADTFKRKPELLDGLDQRVVTPGHVFDLGGADAHVIPTPGHCSDHLSLHVPARKIALVGDLVSGLSTMVIEHDTGDMGDYVESLERVMGLGCKILLAGHGMPVRPHLLERTIRHRAMREERILGVMSTDWRHIDEIAEGAYPEAPNIPLRLKAYQVTSHLLYLLRLGRVERDEKNWRRV